MAKITQHTRLPGKPQYVLVRLDADMAPDGPLRGGKWPVAKGVVSNYYERVLTYHFFPSQEPIIDGCRKLKRGDRVCINAGEYEGCFGTVIGNSRRYDGYTYGVRRSRKTTLTMLVQVEQTTEVEVA